MHYDQLIKRYEVELPSTNQDKNWLFLKKRSIIRFKIRVYQSYLYSHEQELFYNTKQVLSKPVSQKMLSAAIG